MRCLIKREASQDCVQPVWEVARQRDFRRARKKRAVKPDIILERSVQLAMGECRPKAQGEKRQDQNEEDSVFAPEATELIKA